MTSPLDLFEQINNAILNLQGATLQSFERPLKVLGRLLSHSDLATINSELTAGLDVEAFLGESAATQGGMVERDIGDGHILHGTAAR